MERDFSVLFIQQRHEANVEITVIMLRTWPFPYSQKLWWVLESPFGNFCFRI